MELAAPGGSFRGFGASGGVIQQTLDLDLVDTFLRPPAKFSAPRQCKLKLTLAPASFFSFEDRTIVPGPDKVRGGNYFENEWTFWVYPSLNSSLGPLPSCQPAHPTDFLLTSSWEDAEKKLVAGGDVLLVPRNADLNWTSPPLDSVPVFWNRWVVR